MLDMLSAFKYMGNILLTTGPIVYSCERGKFLTKSTNCAFCPLMVHLLVYFVLQHGLHQSMDRKGFSIRVTIHKRIVEQLLDSSIESEWIGRCRFKHCT